MKDKVVLFYPPYEGPPLGPPLSLLTLASRLLEAGFRVTIVDGAIEPDVKATLKKEISDALCLGVSFLTGPMIRSAVDITGFVRRLESQTSHHLWRLALQSSAGANTFA